MKASDSEQHSYDALISRLVADLTPVRRLFHPVIRAALWLAVVAAMAAGLACFADLGAMARRLSAAPDMWLAFVGSTLTAISATLAAFELSLPDRKDAWALAPAPALLLWIAASGLGCLRTWVLPETQVATMEEARDCLLFILGLSVPLSAVLIFMLRRAYTLRPSLTGALGGLAAAAATATLLNFFHPFDAAATDLVVHAIAVALVVFANTILSKKLLRYTSAAT
jgi:hypothetical protein